VVISIFSNSEVISADCRAAAIQAISISAQVAGSGRFTKQVFVASDELYQSHREVHFENRGQISI
jgi:hypothetical protein